MDSVYIVMPAYNEEENIEAVVEQWYQLLDGKGEDSRLVVADSGSTDDTHAILERMAKERPRLVILPTEEKFHGPKLIALYHYAVMHGADYIFQTDSDGQTEPQEFNAFWNQRMTYDVILGHRKKRGDGRFRTFAEKIVCFLLRLYFGVTVPDANAPFRLMKSSIVAKYIDRLPTNYHLPNIMLTTYFAYGGEKLLFNEISFKPRERGRNSVNVFGIVKTGWKALQDFHSFRTDLRESEPIEKKWKLNLNRVAAGAAFCLFFMVTLHKLVHASLWFDEAVEYWYSKVMFGKVPFNDTSNMYERITRTYQPPLYNVLMHFWLKISDTEWWFRFFGVVMGGIGMLGIFKSVRRISKNSVIAAGSVVFASCIYQFAFYWQECAEYCLMLGSLCWTIYYWVCLMEEADRKNIILFTIAAVIPIYSQYGAVFVVVPLGIAAFLHVIRSGNKKNLVVLSISYVCALLFAAVPLYVFFLKKQMLSQQGGELVFHRMWSEGGKVYDFYKSLLTVFRWNLVPYFTKESANILLVAVLLAVFAVLVRGERLQKCIVCINIAAWLLFYLTVKMGLYAKGGFGNRYGLFFIPLWVVSGFAVGLELLRILFLRKTCMRRCVGELYIGVSVCFLICFCMRGWGEIEQNWEKENNRGVVEEWYERGLEDKPTLVYRGTAPGFSYYVRKGGTYTDQTEKNVVYMKKTRCSGEEYTEFINSVYGELWPDEIYILATHFKEEDITVLADQFLSTGYVREDVFASTNSLLIKMGR